MPLGMPRARLEATRTQTGVCHCRFAIGASSMPLEQGRAVSLGGPVGLASGGELLESLRPRKTPEKGVHFRSDMLPVQVHVLGIVGHSMHTTQFKFWSKGSKQ